MLERGDPPLLLIARRTLMPLSALLADERIRLEHAHRTRSAGLAVAGCGRCSRSAGADHVPGVTAWGRRVLAGTVTGAALVRPPAQQRCSDHLRGHGCLRLRGL